VYQKESLSIYIVCIWDSTGKSFHMCW